MTLLALDSSGLVASVAIVAEDAVLAEYTVNYKKTHSQTLLPMLDEIVNMVELDLAKVDGIAVAAGPGSFTGLRIGSATAKGLGLALSKPIIPIPTLEGLAYNLFGTDQLICPMMDARRNQVYTGLYECNQEGLHTISEQKAAAIEDIIDEINQIGRSVIYLGDGTSVNEALIREKTKVDYHFAPAHLSRQRAASIGGLGILYMKQNKVETAAEHAPVYLRLSQAERERAEKLKEEA
ncbi:MAG: tRNA (adenosine(37)-N6)-threonylcarbamoyltransferase complex dimerization subunit type 1 TsaB [Lachnospiraceae bacterium]|jgi:tRNA threonylcarbamoyladenosine biosynthesis protein TsaB|nr:tRNA (adenosine(37)-N6)-threonylcarbamoyltransferase complex dimerization subunit type 1 TsaB [Lachnospiraceae bacterium]